jgi:hypothetical protein
MMASGGSQSLYGPTLAELEHDDLWLTTAIKAAEVSIRWLIGCDAVAWARTQAPHAWDR